MSHLLNLAQMHLMAPYFQPVNEVHNCESSNRHHLHKTPLKVNETF